jgi:hypothetical protein
VKVVRRCGDVVVVVATVSGSLVTKMASLPLFWCFAGVFGGLDLVVVPDLL